MTIDGFCDVPSSGDHQKQPQQPLSYFRLGKIQSATMLSAEPHPERASALATSARTRASPRVLSARATAAAAVAPSRPAAPRSLRLRARSRVRLVMSWLPSEQPPRDQKLLHRRGRIAPAKGGRRDLERLQKGHQNRRRAHRTPQGVEGVPGLPLPLEPPLPPRP